MKPIDRDLRQWRFIMLFQRIEISVIGAQSEMKNARFLSRLLKFDIFEKLYMFKLMGREKDWKEIS